MKQNIGITAYFVLRIACAMCFIGHGAFGLIGKAMWCNYFGVVGIDKDFAYTLMPYVGMMDILMGLIILFYPLKAAVAWLVVWGIITASMRPFSGEPFAEMIERGGNYGAPLAILLLTSAGIKNGGWFKPLLPHSVNVNAMAMKRVMLCLRIVVFLLLLGHGWLNILEKKSLI